MLFPEYLRQPTREEKPVSNAEIRIGYVNGA
jgi:hypothetical protein